MQSSLPELMMYLADAPRMTKKKTTPKQFESDDELAAWLGAE